MHVHVHVYLYVYVYECMYVYMCLCVYVCIYPCIYIYIHICISKMVRGLKISIRNLQIEGKPENVVQTHYYFCCIFVDYYPNYKKKFSV